MVSPDLSHNGSNKTIIQLLPSVRYCQSDNRLRCFVKTVKYAILKNKQLTDLPPRLD